MVKKLFSPVNVLRKQWRHSKFWRLLHFNIDISEHLNMILTITHSHTLLNSDNWFNAFIPFNIRDFWGYTSFGYIFTHSLSRFGEISWIVIKTGGIAMMEWHIIIKHISSLNYLSCQADFFLSLKMMSILGINMGKKIGKCHQKDCLFRTYVEHKQHFNKLSSQNVYVSYEASFM